jgi:signal transduction histidine kinase
MSAEPTDHVAGTADPTGEEPHRVGSAHWWRHTALRLRAALAFGLLSLVLSAALSTAAYGLVRSNLLEERREVAERQAYTNARLLRTRIDPLPEDMSSLLAGLQVGSGGDTLVNVDELWFSSSLEVTDAVLPASLVEVVDQGRSAVQTVERDDEPAMVVGVPIATASAGYYELTSLAAVSSTLRALAGSLFVAGLVATVAGAALGAALSTVILSPLRRFATVATRISAGETGGAARLDAAGDADLEPLASSFNEMLDELDERIERERRFASDVSHEIRGPVAALASAVSVVDRRRDQLPSEIVPVVDALDEQVTAFNQLVLDLLEISRFDARRAELVLDDVDVVQLCEKVIEERGHDGIELHADGPVEGGVDRRRVAQVVANLLDNAASYAGGATDVTVRRAIAGTVVGGEVVQVLVEDRGPGVAEDERDEIFARFRRGGAADAPGAGPGTGLGLALSRQHVELHGGALWVQDRDGGGACFVVELPAAGASDEAGEEP